MSRFALCAMILSALVAAPACSPSKNSQSPQSESKDAKPAAAVADVNQFKIEITYHDLNESESITSTLVFRQDRVFEIVKGSTEFTIIDLADGKVHLVGVQKNANCELTQAQVDAGYDKYINERRRDAAELLAKGNTNEQASAKSEMLYLSPALKQEPNDAPPARVRMRSEGVDVSFTGNADATRLERVYRSLVTLLKLPASRDGEWISPQAHLDAFKVMKEKYSLIPTELVFLFKFREGPAKYRWTYKLTPNLTDRELEAVRRVEAFLASTKTVPHQRYERIILNQKRPVAPATK